MKDNPEKIAEARKQITRQNVVQHLRSISKWGSKIYPFVLENGYCSDQEKKEEKKSKRALNGQYAATLSLLLYHRYATYDEAFTVRSLAKAIDGEDVNSRKAQERQIMRLLQSTACYQLIDFYRDTHQGNRECIRIEPTELLINFFENCFFKK